MAHDDQIRPLADVPDHGFGLLGALAHSVLADCADLEPPVPRLHLGQNILPNPPFPMAARVAFEDPLESWGPCDGNLAAFLAAAAQHLRGLPIPDASEYSQSARILQRVLRFDAMAIAWPSPGALDPCAAEPSTGETSAGVLSSGDTRAAEPGAEPGPALPTLITVAVDRAGKALYGWMPQGGSTAEIELTEGLTASDTIVALLLDVLLAQYEWTCKVFGLMSLPGFRPQSITVPVCPASARPRRTCGPPERPASSARITGRGGGSGRRSAGLDPAGGRRCAGAGAQV